MLKKEIIIKELKGIYLVTKNGEPPRKFKPWMGDRVAFLYDFFMEKFVIPKQLSCNVDAHYKILKDECSKIHEKKVLELGTGSGCAIRFLQQDNQYTGIDISRGLLIRAIKRFKEAHFNDPKFYLVSAEDLPFNQRVFDYCLCVLSLNFFSNLRKVLEEVHRTLKTEGVMICSVPIPERISKNKVVHGNLQSEAEYENIFKELGYTFVSLPYRNGALLYFRAVKRNSADSIKKSK